MLEHADYMLLEKIKQCQPVSIEQLIAQFSSKIDGINSRISNLKTYDCIDFEYVDQNVGYGIIAPTATNNYTITDLGMKALQDYKISTKQKKQELWLQSCWIPIIVSLATNLFFRILPYILSLLKPIIQRVIE